MNAIKNNSPRIHALIAGISLIIMAIAAIYAYGYVFGQLITEGDPEATWDQLSKNKRLYISGLAGWIIIFITDLLVTLSLCYFFRETRKKLSMVTALMRLTYTVILGIALIGLFTLIPVLNEGEKNTLEAGNQALEAMGRFERTWSVGLIIFGIHLLGLGYLGILKVRMPNLLGYLLLVGGIGYLVVHISRILPLVPYETVDLMESILMLPMALGEILLALWLIMKGGRRKNL